LPPHKKGASTPFPKKFPEMKTPPSGLKFKTPSLAPSRRTRRTSKKAGEKAISAPKVNLSAKRAGAGAGTSDAPEPERVSFDWVFPKAKQVCIAGSFNNWESAATPLKNCGGGRWLLDLPLKPGRYEFRFVVDGQWVDEPGVTSRFLFVN